MIFVYFPKQALSIKMPCGNVLEKPVPPHGILLCNLYGLVFTM